MEFESKITPEEYEAQEEERLQNLSDDARYQADIDRQDAINKERDEKLKQLDEELSRKDDRLQPITADEQAGVTTDAQRLEQLVEVGDDQAKRDDWYTQNVGMSESEIIESNELSNNLFLQGLGVVPMGLADTVVDIATIPFGQSGQDFDDWWDESTKFNNKYMQAARNIAGVVVPVGGLTGLAAKGIKAAKMSRLATGLSIFGADVAIDSGFIATTDQGKDDNIFRVLDDTFPWLNVPDDIKTLDDDSAEVRRIKNIYASGPMSIVGNVLGNTLAYRGKLNPFSWFKPKSVEAEDTLKAMKSTQVDPESLLAVNQIDTALATPENLTKAEIKTLKAARQKILEDMDTKGVSDATSNPVKAKTERQLDADALELEEAAIKKIEEDPLGTNFEPLITSKLVPEGTLGREAVKEGAVFRNAAELTAINKGLVNGDPPKLVSESMLRKFLKAGGSSREMVEGLLKKVTEAGDYEVNVGRFRFTKSQMDEEAFDMYTKIIGANDADEVRRLFRRDTKNIADGTVEYISESDTIAAGFAMRDLTDRYLGRPVAAQSARVMKTQAHEIGSLSFAAKELEGMVDQDDIYEQVADKLAVLTEEYALSKYVAGWQLRNKNFFKSILGAKNADEIAKMTVEEFDVASSKSHQQALNLRKSLIAASKENPQMMRPLMDAFVLSNGNVDTIDKVGKWAFQQITPTNYLYNKEGMNLFSKGLTSVVLNNVLSGLSAGRAVIANTAALIQAPINAALGTGAINFFSKDADELKRFMYIHGGWGETNRRSVSNAWKTLKAVNADPTVNLDKIRGDLQMFDDKTWDTIDEVAEATWKGKNAGAYGMYTWAKIQKNVAQWPAMRWGTTAMSGADGYVNSHMASKVARIRAYDNVARSGEEVTEKALRAAEKKVYAEMFDESGRMTDWAASHMSGEVALNLDNEFAGAMTMGMSRMPWLRHFMMFPKTGMNALEVAGSYVGVSAIPGVSKYSKVLYARTKQEIAEALAAHGLKDMSTDPNAMAIFKHLKREYSGRLAFSASLTAALWTYAMSGKIRGNGAISAGDRKNQRDTLGYRTKEVMIGDKWVSFAGLDTVEPVLSILGDLAYHARDISPEKSEDLRARVTWTLAATFMDKTFLTGLEPFFSIIDGNETAFNKSAANIGRSMIPGSGGLGVIANAVSSSQKDIYNDMIGYVKNRLPVVNMTLPEQIDFWTGKPLNDIDNPSLRLLNALSPIKVSNGQEPWRKWLYETGWDGMSMLRMDSTGNHEYTPEQREKIYKYMSEDNLDKVIAGSKFMGNSAFNTMLGQLRALKQEGKKPIDRDGNPIEFEVALLPVHRAINALLTASKKHAEQRLLTENPELANSIFLQRQVDSKIRRGDVSGAARVADKRVQQISEFSQHYKK